MKEDEKAVLKFDLELDKFTQLVIDPVLEKVEEPFKTSCKTLFIAHFGIFYAMRFASEKMSAEDFSQLAQDAKLAATDLTALALNLSYVALFSPHEIDVLMQEFLDLKDKKQISPPEDTPIESPFLAKVTVTDAPGSDDLYDPPLKEKPNA